MWGALLLLALVHFGEGTSARGSSDGLAAFEGWWGKKGGHLASTAAFVSARVECEEDARSSFSVATTGRLAKETVRSTLAACS